MSADGTINARALDRLTETLGGDPADLLDIIESFLEEAPSILRDMRQALVDGELTSLRRAAHSLKSNARDLGAERLAGMCQSVETRLGDVAGLAEPAAEVGQIEMEWHNVGAALHLEMQRIRGQG